MNPLVTRQQQQNTQTRQPGDLLRSILADREEPLTNFRHGGLKHIMASSEHAMTSQVTSVDNNGDSSRASNVNQECQTYKHINQWQHVQSV